MMYQVFALMQRKSKKFFDTIDFTKYIPEGESQVSVRTLMDILETFYDENHPNLLPEWLEGCFFNFINEYEFAEYLKERYGYLITEEVEPHYYIQMGWKKVSE